MYNVKNDGQMYNMNELYCYMIVFSSQQNPFSLTVPALSLGAITELFISMLFVCPLWWRADGEPKMLSEIVKRCIRTGFTSKIRAQDDGNVEFTSGAYSYSEQFGELQFEDVYDEKYLVAFSVCADSKATGECHDVCFVRVISTYHLLVQVPLRFHSVSFRCFSLNHPMPIIMVLNVLLFTAYMIRSSV